MNAWEVLPGVWQIQDDMGVCMTLLCGGERALLIDTGYGLSDTAQYVSTLSDLPVSVILTHAHHDHALGARWFEETRMFAQDLPDFAIYTAKAQRERVLAQAQAKGLTPPVDYLTADIPVPGPLCEGAIDLGGLTAQVVLCPGHTPGSAVIFVPERKLLLTGDDWNPCTWLFFPSALGAQSYRENVRGLLRLPVEHVLCSHQPHLYERGMLEQFLSGLTDDCLLASRKVDMGWPIDTREAAPADGQIFVFDFGKTNLKEKDA